MFYLLTNSRALTGNQTAKLHKELTCNVIRAAKATAKEFMIISRSDSTLRGHYPLETELVKQVVESKMNTVIDGLISIGLVHTSREVILIRIFDLNIHEE